MFVIWWNVAAVAYNGSWLGLWAATGHPWLAAVFSGLLGISLTALLWNIWLRAYG